MLSRFLLLNYCGCLRQYDNTTNLFHIGSKSNQNINNMYDIYIVIIHEFVAYVDDIKIISPPPLRNTTEDYE